MEFNIFFGRAEFRVKLSTKLRTVTPENRACDKINNIFAATEMGWFSAKSITRKPNLLGIDKMKFFRRGEFRVKLSIKLRGPTELFNTRKPCLRQNKKNISGHRDGLFKSKKYHSTV